MAHPLGKLLAETFSQPAEQRRNSSRLQKVGRCRACKVVYVWRGPVSVRDAVCPGCGQRLRRTTYLCRDPRVQLSDAPPAKGWLTT
jgi:rRNA maturation endonuclease Nob1